LAKLVYTADQQLHRVVMHLQWYDSSGFFHQVLGGMHLLMSYKQCRLIDGEPWLLRNPLWTF